jgi:hypothetical protein
MEYQSWRCCLSTRQTQLLKIALDGRHFTLLIRKTTTILKQVVVTLSKLSLLVEVLEGYIKENYPKFLSTFDPKKPRDFDRHHRIQAAKHSTLNPEERRSVMNGNTTLQGIADLIKSGKCKKIVVLTGAGISVSAGSKYL